jgi:hypothetical protein
VDTFLLGVECFVTLLDEPFEETIEDTLAEGTDGVVDLILVTTLCDELVTDLDTWLKQVLVQVLGVNTEQLGDLLTSFGTVSLSLFLATSLFELHSTHVHDSGGDLVDVVLLLLCETQDIEGLLLGSIELLRLVILWGLASLSVRKINFSIVKFSKINFSYFYI